MSSRSPHKSTERELALADLEAIRHVLDRTTRYTQISSVGIALGGVSAVIAALVGRSFDVFAVGASSAAPVAEASKGFSPIAFLSLWGSAFVVALTVGAWTTARKARRSGELLWNRKLQFVLLRFSPCLVLGAVFTAGLAHTGYLDLAPGIWLGLYGLGILSVSMVLDWEFQLTGWSFIVCSTAAFFLLRDDAHLALLVGFGCIHIILGTYRLLKEQKWQRARRSPSFRS